MNKTISGICCIVLAIVMIVPAFVCAVGAADDIVNLYDAALAVSGTPNNANRDTAPSTSENYYCSAPINVKEGDVITAGPVMKDQGYYFTAYKEDGSVHTKQVKYANCTEVEVIAANSVIVKWTVPAGVDSIRMATAQTFVDNTLITKNREFSKADYLAYMEKTGADVSYFTGVNSDALTNIFPVSDTTFAGRGSTGGDVASADYMTSDYVPVVEGDVVYFGGAVISQGYQLVLYDADKKPTTHVNYKHMVRVEDIDDTHCIYAYRMRPGTAFVRVVAATAVYNEGLQLATVNQPFTAEGYNNYFNPPEVTEPEVTDPVPPAETGDSVAIFAVVAIISVFGIAIVAKRREN